MADSRGNLRWLAAVILHLRLAVATVDFLFLLGRPRARGGSVLITDDVRYRWLSRLLIATASIFAGVVGYGVSHVTTVVHIMLNQRLRRGQLH
jgi:hypothetical protein